MPRVQRSNSLASRSALTFAAVCALAGVSAGPAAAAAKSVKLVSGVEAVCEGQLFSQAFLSYSDSRYYTLLPGAEFSGGAEGWTLSGGASIATAIRPTGAPGGVLNLPVGSRAVSPPMCVTLAYPSARAWLSGEQENHNARVSVSVSYAGTASAISPQAVKPVRAPHGTWTLGEFSVEPSLAGKEEAPREVRFIFEGSRGTSQLYDIYIDPRMTH